MIFRDLLIFTLKLIINQLSLSLTQLPILVKYSNFNRNFNKDHFITIPRPEIHFQWVVKIVDFGNVTPISHLR